MAKIDPISSTEKIPNTLQNHNACNIKIKESGWEKSRYRALPCLRPPVRQIYVYFVALNMIQDQNADIEGVHV